ncbi:unnamed protein product [Rotaria sordida]|uniref:Uncharacterized protein n=1 Tax=Rotaria sordida TaxID=392033 RepID=A0A814NV30_9BILA|nr:unnamed protein product [Rotaria sordida]CAF1581782.1 unnamed protein product [Rotaria sordida]
MINLRVLHVQYENEIDCGHIPLIMNDDESHNVSIPNEDELIQWLKDHLLSTCLIVKDPNLISRIQIWI